MTDSIEMGATLIDEAEKARREHLAHLHATYAAWTAFRQGVINIANHLGIEVDTRLGPRHREYSIQVHDNFIEVGSREYRKDSPGFVCLPGGSVAADETLAAIATELGKMAAQRDFENPE